MTDFEMETLNFVLFLLISIFSVHFQAIYMQQYFVKLSKLFSQLYTVFVFLMPQHDNGGFLKIAQKRDSISKKTSFCIMVINTDHQES